MSGFKGLLEGQYDDLPEMAFTWLGILMKQLQKLMSWQNIGLVSSFKCFK